MRGFQEGQVVVGEEAVDNKRFHHFLAHVGELAEPGLGLVDPFIELVVGHDLDVPADQLGGQADVLTAAADGQGQLILLDQHDGPAQTRVQEHLLDGRRLQGVGDHDLQRVVPADDVDAFAAELIDDVLDT